MPARPRNDDDLLHHCALMWSFAGVHSSKGCGGLIIPRQASAAVIDRARALFPRVTAEEAMLMALCPRVLLVDLADIVDPGRSHDARGISRQTAADAHVVWPSYQEPGSALATVSIIFRCCPENDEAFSKASQEAATLLRKHCKAVFGSLYKMSPEDARLVISGRSDLREGLALSSEIQGQRLELDSELPHAPSAPRPSL